ncbi:MAG: hypothetical protein ACXAEU_04585 [Candidatus Hodarchaeales archaeon]
MSYDINSLEEQLKRVLFDFGEEIVSFRFLKPFDGLEVAGVVLPAVDKKSLKNRIELPRFAAEILQERGHGVMTLKQEININEIYNKLQEEQNSTALESISESYLIDVNKSFNRERLKLKGQKDLSEDLRKTRERKIVRMENDYTTLVKRRREKIFRKIGTLDDTEIRKKLTRSEKVLYDAISKILREWEKNVLKEKFDDL